MELHRVSYLATLMFSYKKEDSCDSFGQPFIIIIIINLTLVFTNRDLYKFIHKYEDTDDLLFLQT